MFAFLSALSKPAAAIRAGLLHTERLRPPSWASPGTIKNAAALIFRPFQTKSAKFFDLLSKLVLFLNAQLAAAVMCAVVSKLPGLIMIAEQRVNRAQLSPAVLSLDRAEQTCTQKEQRTAKVKAASTAYAQDAFYLGFPGGPAAQAAYPGKFFKNSHSTGFAANAGQLLSSHLQTPATPAFSGCMPSSPKADLLRTNLSCISYP
jgi:hypothetical protein